MGDDKHRPKQGREVKLFRSIELMMTKIKFH
jgi:hypothetical protein